MILISALTFILNKAGLKLCSKYNNCLPLGIKVFSTFVYWINKYFSSLSPLPSPFQQPVFQENAQVPTSGTPALLHPSASKH